MEDVKVTLADLEKAPTVDSGDIPAEIVKHANDADEAMKAFQGHEGQVIVLDEATNKRLLRKIDLHLMPVDHHRFCGRDECRLMRMITVAMCHIRTQLSRQYGIRSGMRNRTKLMGTRNHSVIRQCHGHKKGYTSG